jgi:hypothetical protein
MVKNDVDAETKKGEIFIILTDMTFFEDRKSHVNGIFSAIQNTSCKCFFSAKHDFFRRLKKVM